MFQQVSSAMWGFTTYVFPASLAGTLLEVLIPGEKQSVQSRLRAIPIWIVYIFIGVSSGALLRCLLDLLHIRPLLSVDLKNATNSNDVVVIIAAYAVFPAVGFFIYDFFYYWFHRLQHTFRVLWRVHAVHHSIEELNAFNDYHHWLENALRVPLILLPMSLLISVRTFDVIVYTMILQFMGQMTHANSKISYGLFRYVFSEPRYHRIHHSAEKRHWGKNFAFMFPFWDVVFGTAYFPKPDEYPRTGLPQQREPRSIVEYITAPFRR
ncbi:MAG: sterol desaturase family protein [Verrucomicrobia bacterium]|nr:sterol desaturase family protein [Verrucomicrobiota bacterium]